MQALAQWTLIVALAGSPACQQGPRGGQGVGSTPGGGQAQANVGPTGVGPARTSAGAGSDGGAEAGTGGPVTATSGDGGAGGPVTATSGGPVTATSGAAPPTTATSGATVNYWAGGAAPSSGPTAVAGPIAGADPTGGGPVIPTTSAGEMAELMASINRKTSHDDGKGCLEDLERLRVIDPRLMKTMIVLEAQCVMLIGECQRGKRMIADYYKDQTNMTEERAMITAESIGSMRCRGGDMSERDQLLGALDELSDGAYMNERSPKFCSERIERVRALAPKVKPRSPDDGQVIGGPQALFYTGAACLARAGDCPAAYRAYAHDFPKDGLAAIQDPAQAAQIVEDSFRSSIERCKSAKLGGK